MMPKYCEECDGSGRIPCDAPWCSDRDHDGACRDCDGTGLLHVPCLYCGRLCMVGEVGANCHYCDISASLRDGRWHVVLPALAVPFVWIGCVAWRASVIAKTQLRSSLELEELPYERTWKEEDR